MAGARGSANVTIVIADDQTLIRDGLVTICAQFDDVDVVATASDGAEAVAAVAQHAPHVVLMDLRMPRMDGIEATRQIRENHPASAVVVLTTYSDDESISAALAAGAIGYLTKDAGRDDIHRAVQSAARGQALLDPVVYARVVQLAQQHAVGSTDAPLPDGLTVREAEVLASIGRGLSNAEIAETLYVSEATVKTHINRIFAKTQSRDRAQAVAYAHRHGLVEPGA